jgi:hypothetical protein
MFMRIGIQPMRKSKKSTETCLEWKMNLRVIIINLKAKYKLLINIKTN